MLLASGPINGHCVGLLVAQQMILLFAMTLRGFSGGPPGATAWSLKGGEGGTMDGARQAGGPKGPQRARPFLPGSPTQWPPEGPRRVSAEGAEDDL